MSAGAQYATMAAYHGGAAPTPSAALRVVLWFYVVTFPLTGFMLLDFKSISFGLDPGYLFSFLLMLIWFSWRERKAMVPAFWPAVLYGLMTFFSVVQSAAIPPDAADFADRSRWSFSFTQSLYVGWTLLIFLILANIFITYPQLRRRVLRWHIMAACVACCWGIYQWLAFYFGWQYITFFNNNPYRYNLFDQTFLGVRRVNSTMLEPSEFGLYLLTVVPLLYVQPRKEEEILANGFRIFALILTTTTLFLTTSMSGYVSFFIFLLMFVATGNRWRNRRVSVAIVATILCFALAAAVFASAGGALREAMVERIVSSSDNPDLSTLERQNAAFVGLSMFRANPIFGVGEGNYGFFYDQFTDAYNTNALPRVYSLLSRILAEHGLIGGFLFAFLLYRIFRPQGLRSPPPNSVVYTLLCFALIASLVDTFAAMADMCHFYMWMIAALLASTTGATTYKTSHPAMYPYGSTPSAT